MRWLSRTLPFVLLLVPRLAGAHAGPPFPILVDQKAGPYVASVWSDPDIGIGTFFVTLETPEGQRPTLPKSVRIGVQPVSGRLAVAFHDAEPQEVRKSEGARYFAEVPFDQGGMWKVRVEIDGAVLGTEVEATPDGTIGPVSLVLYSLPFLAVGLIWLKAARVKRAVPEETTRSSLP